MKYILVAIFALCLVASVLAGGNPTVGAIFTTTADGETVNGNIYADKNDVYLNGGPQANCGSAGLTDGDYYFQVTDPSGKVLLSQDAMECRTAVVSGGYWVGAGATAVECSHNEVPYKYGCAGQMQTQLMPYADTPNPGGEYKAWATLISDFDWDNFNLYYGGELSIAARKLGFSFGFSDQDSKTDNYKVRISDVYTTTPPTTSTTTSDSSSSSTSDSSSSSTSTSDSSSSTSSTSGNNCDNVNDETCVCASLMEGTTLAWYAVKFDDGYGAEFVLSDYFDFSTGYILYAVVKAGSYDSGWGAGNDAPVVAPDEDTVLEHSSGKDISHVIICVVPIGTTTTTTDATTTTTDATTTTTDATTTTTDATTTTTDATTTTTDATTTTTDATTTTTSSTSTTGSDCPRRPILGVCSAVSPCGRCAEIAISQDGEDTVYTITNRCENAVSYIEIGLEGPLKSGGASASSEWVISSNDDVVTFTDKKDEVNPANKLKNGASQEFRVKLQNLYPAAKQSLLVVTGDKFDYFKFAIGNCLTPYQCPPPAGAQWAVYCIPDAGEWIQVTSPVVIPGANVVDANCQCVGTPPPVGTGTVGCSSLDCYGCLYDADWMVGEGACAWDGEQCVPSGFAAQVVTECAEGQIPYVPNGCPQNCSGKGVCNTTADGQQYCVCFNYRNKGLNCGSRNGVSGATAAAIAGGALAGIIIGAVVIAGVVFLVISYGGYKGYDLINTSDFSQGRAFENPGYVGSGREMDVPAAVRG